MTPRFNVPFSAAILAASAALALPASARDDTMTCAANISAIGVSSHVEGGRDFERYRGEVPPGLARKRAIDNWQLRVANACPKYSNKWWRSRGQRVDCEGAVGHEYCTASSAPARKFWSFLVSD